MTGNELKVIRENIACPQFGDDHYGPWGALNISQRRTIYQMWNEITRQKAEIENYKQIAEHQQSVSMDRHFEILRLKEEIKRLENLLCFNNGERSAAE